MNIERVEISGKEFYALINSAENKNDGLYD